MNYYEPKYLRGVIQKVLPLRQFFHTRFFPENVLFATETVSIEYARGTRKLAAYTSPRFGGVMDTREGYEVRTYHTPYLLPMRVITNDTLAQKVLGEQPYNSGMTPEDRAAQIAADDIMELQDRIMRREEYMCARCIQDGALEVKGPGVNDVVDYGFTGIEVTQSGDKWTAGYDLIGKLSGTAQAMRKNGTNPDMLILGSAAANAFLSNSKVSKIMDMRQVDMGAINPRDLEDGVMYIGRLAVPGFVGDIYSYDEYYTDDDGTEKPLVDPSTAVLISSRARNSMLYGAVTYIDVKTGEYVTEMNQYVPYTNYSVNPPVKEIYLASRPLPMPKDLDSWRVLKEVV